MPEMKSFCYNPGSAAAISVTLSSVVLSENLNVWHNEISDVISNQDIFGLTYNCWIYFIVGMLI